MLYEGLFEYAYSSDNHTGLLDRANAGVIYGRVTVRLVDLQGWGWGYSALQCGGVGLNSALQCGGVGVGVNLQVS